jgi:hypothetical protein
VSIRDLNRVGQQHWRALSTRRSGAAAEQTPVLFGAHTTHQVAQMLRSAKLGPRQPASLGPNTRTGSCTSRARQGPSSQPTVTAANGNGNGSGTARQCRSQRHNPGLVPEAWCGSTLSLGLHLQTASCAVCVRAESVQLVTPAVYTLAVSDPLMHAMLCLLVCSGRLLLDICCLLYSVVQMLHLARVIQHFEQSPNSSLVVILDCGRV